MTSARPSSFPPWEIASLQRFLRSKEALQPDLPPVEDAYRMGRACHLNGPPPSVRSVCVSVADAIGRMSPSSVIGQVDSFEFRESRLAQKKGEAGHAAI